jgi:ATP-dependent DNA ligase
MGCADFVARFRITYLKKSECHCPRLLYAQHIERYGKRFFEEVCARDLEGIVAKRKFGVYKDDGNEWLKIKKRSIYARHELLKRRK